MKIITLRLSETEYKAIKDEAHIQKTTMNQLIRDIVKDSIMREQR